jgi:hypothetical protein
MIDLIKATSELYGDCSQEVGSIDIYINGVLATAAQMMAINAKADANLIVDSKTGKITLLTQAYNAAIQQPVSYMGTTFQADPDSVTKLMQVLAAMSPVGATPTGFYWVDALNNHVAMTLAQAQGLAQAIMGQGWAAFQNLQTKKASVASATSVIAVQAIVF